MSAKLARRVLESGLSPALKPLLTAMALFGNEDGERIYPSVDRLAFMLGKTRRSIEKQLSKLRADHVLVPVDSTAGGRLPGGRGRSVMYFLDVNALPARPPFQPRRTANNPVTRDGVQPLETPSPVSGLVDIFGLDNPVTSGDRTLSSPTSTPSPVTETPSPAPRYPVTSDGRVLEGTLRETVRETVRENKPTDASASALSCEKANTKTQDQDPDRNPYGELMERFRRDHPNLVAGHDRRMGREGKGEFTRLAEISEARQ
jgi:hypothetical protein